MSKLETGAMLNPKCQNCRKKDSCNNKTLCAYLIPPKEIKPDRSLNDSMEKAMADIIFTPEMLAEQLQKDLLNKQFEIGIDIGKGYSQQGVWK